MRISIKHYDEIFEWDFKDVEATQVLEKLCRAMLIMGFQPDSIDRSILELAEELEGK